jgi:choline-glycine betaine transporter
MNPQTHMERFGRAYLVGALFVLVSVANAIYGEFGEIKPDELNGFTRFQWFLHWDSVVVAAGTVILAFLNQSMPHTPPAENPPTKTITTVLVPPTHD